MIYELLIAMQQNSASNNVTVSLTNMIFSLHDVLHPFPVSFAFIKRLSIIKMIYIIKWYIYIYIYGETKSEVFSEKLWQSKPTIIETRRV